MHTLKNFHNRNDFSKQFRLQISLDSLGAQAPNWVSYWRSLSDGKGMFDSRLRELPRYGVWALRLGLLKLTVRIISREEVV
mgnify:CR=1 FL=1